MSEACFGKRRLSFCYFELFFFINSVKVELLIIILSYQFFFYKLETCCCCLNFKTRHLLQIFFLRNVFKTTDVKDLNHCRGFKDIRTGHLLAAIVEILCSWSFIALGSIYELPLSLPPLAPFQLHKTNLLASGFLM